MIQYKDLILRVLREGTSNQSRAGDTVYKFGESISFDLNVGFPIVTARKIDYEQAFGELAAFIQGATSKAEFKKYGCNYWDTTKGPWTDNDDLLGYIYGAQWRSFNGASGCVDQLKRLIDGLRAEPQSRRHILTTWQPAELHLMALPPCHIMAQFDVNPDGMLWHGGMLSCAVYMRSVDIMLGLPYDIILYALLTHLLAEECGYGVKDLHFFFGNAHIYKNHITSGNVDELLYRQTYALPRLTLDCPNILNFHPAEAQLDGYVSNGPLKFELNL